MVSKYDGRTLARNATGILDAIWTGSLNVATFCISFHAPDYPVFAPAARVTDTHVCPKSSGKVPHVGGPIVPPCHTTTLIAALPAARITDLAACVGPPDVVVTGSYTVLIGGLPAARLGDTCAHGGKIVTGCMTVFIGDTATGAGPQTVAMSMARVGAKPFVETNCASKSVPAPLFASDPKKKSWIEIVLVDEAGDPVPHERYRVTAPDGTAREGFLDGHGFARVAGIDPGTCKVTFPNLDQDTWEST